MDQVEVATARSKAIVDRIEALKATMLEGLKVKALALSWTHHGNAMDAEDESEWGRTTDKRLVAQIASALISMAGGRDGGYPEIAALY